MLNKDDAQKKTVEIADELGYMGCEESVAITHQPVSDFLKTPRQNLKNYTMEGLAVCEITGYQPQKGTPRVDLIIVDFVEFRACLQF